MPKIVYAGPSRAVEVSGIVCQYGEEVAFPADVAASLLEQDVWCKPGDAPAPDAPCRGAVDYDSPALDVEPDADPLAEPATTTTDGSPA